MAEQLKQLDNRIEIVTPENIAFQYQVAGPFRRLAAFLLDLLVRVLLLLVLVVIFLALAAALGSTGAGLGVGMMLMGYFVLDWFYGGLFEALWNGQTPGKHALRIRVLSVNGQPIHAWQAILRNVLRAADALPVVFVLPTYQLGLLAMLFNDRFQRLGDLACGTMVVIEEPQRLDDVVRVQEPEALRLAALLPANFPVSRTLALALSNYVQRRLSFPPARRAEIARHLGEPLRVRFNLPPQTSHDLLLCALYQVAFIEFRPGADAERPATPSSQRPEGPLPAGDVRAQPVSPFARS